MDETNEVKIRKAIDHLADQIMKTDPNHSILSLDQARAIEHLANALKTLN